jgi:hypothetical protein
MPHSLLLLLLRWWCTQCAVAPLLLLPAAWSWACGWAEPVGQWGLGAVITQLALLPERPRLLLLLQLQLLLC